MNESQLHDFCKSYAKWVDSRKFYVKPASKNILARMQPSRSGTPPNATNDAEMQHFHHAVRSLKDIEKHISNWVCFNLYYLEHAPNVKVEAGRIGISRPTYYNRAKAFARDSLILSNTIKALYTMESIKETEEID